jgi:preprotein translocase subunit SecA
LYDIFEDVIDGRVQTTFNGINPDREDEANEAIKGFNEWVSMSFPIAIPENFYADAGYKPDDISEQLCQKVRKAYELKSGMENPETIHDLERNVILHSIDSLWQEFLRSIDDLRQGVFLQQFGQKDPLVEFKKGAFEMFQDLLVNIKEDAAGRIFRSTTSIQSMESFLKALPHNLVHDEVSMLGGPMPAGNDDSASKGRGRREVSEAIEAASAPVVRDAPKVGRNDPCPCGSGKKYKKCCGAG